MGKSVEIGLLLDYYGSLLSETQYNIAEMYYNQDLSLSEISEIVGITRQAVHENVRRTEALLLGFEDKLRMKSTHEKIKSALVGVLNILNGLCVEGCEELSQVVNLINNIAADLEG